MILFSRELLRLLIVAVFVIGLVAIDLRVLIPFVLLGYLFVRPRQATAWDANDES